MSSVGQRQSQERTEAPPLANGGYRNGSARHANRSSVIDTQPKSQAGLPVSEEEFCLRKSRHLSRRCFVHGKLVKNV